MISASIAQQIFTVAELNYMLSPNNSFVQKDTIPNAQYFSGFMNALQLGFFRPLVVTLFGFNWDVTSQIIYPNKS